MIIDGRTVTAAVTVSWIQVLQVVSRDQTYKSYKVFVPMELYRKVFFVDQVRCKLTQMRIRKKIL